MYHLGRSAKLNKDYISGRSEEMIKSFGVIMEKVVIRYSGRAKNHYEVQGNKMNTCDVLVFSFPFCSSQIIDVDTFLPDRRLQNNFCGAVQLWFSCFSQN